MENKRFALVGKMGSGKTTIADALVNQYQGVRLALADKLKKDVMKFNLTEDGQIIKSRDRALLQNYGQLRRNELKSLKYHEGELVTYEGQFGSYLYNKKRNGKLLTYENIGENYPNYWIAALLEKIETLKVSNIILVDDVRRINEAQALKKENFTIIKINCNDEIRFKRLSERDGSFDKTTLNDISESEIDSIKCDQELINETTLKDAMQQFDSFYQYL